MCPVCTTAYLDGLDVDTALADEARSKLLSQAGSGSLNDDNIAAAAAAAKAPEEGEIITSKPDVELTEEEDAALEALEAKEFVQYVLGLL